MAKINTTNYQPVTAWDGTQDLFVVEQPDGTKVATPEQVKQYVLNDMDEVPTQDSNKPVKSGGVFSAINDSASLKSATGNPITLTDAANANAEELSMAIEPIQSGSGDPSPDNVRPISGLTSGEVQTTNGTDTNTASITFGQTVYGGSVDFKTGEVTVTHANIASYNGESINEPWLSSLDKYESGATPTTGAQVVYPLSTPVTLTLTPAELELLKGNNTITANGAEISIGYYPDNAIGALAGRVEALEDDVDSLEAQIANRLEIQNNAGFHNSIYRGKNLGSEVTAEQYAAIAAGTFDDMYIGDYWVINGVNWRIAHFDYWLNTGDTECTTHHVVLVPDTNLYTAKMNNSNVTTGAYVGSAMYTTNLAQAKTTINDAFDASHILNHREYLANAMKATADPTYESAGAWYDSTVELMNERMVYGADVFHNVEVNGAIPTNYTIDKSQLALFALDPSRICKRANWWLRCAMSAASFAYVGSDGLANYYYASSALGVRPAFGIKA